MLNNILSFGAIFKRWALFTPAVLVACLSHSQIIAPQLVNSSGTKMSQSNGSLSFTIGELVVLSQTDQQGNTLIRFN